MTSLVTGHRVALPGMFKGMPNNLHLPVVEKMQGAKMPFHLPNLVGFALQVGMKFPDGPPDHL